MGIPWEESLMAGQLLGVKTALNEFVAYLYLSDSETYNLSEKSRLIMLYALCGFANFGSIGIQIAGIGGLAPERRGDLAKLSLVLKSYEQQPVSPAQIPILIYFPLTPHPALSNALGNYHRNGPI